MDSFIKEFNEGQQGKNLGLPLGLSTLDKAINGLQRKRIISIAAAPKVGKTQLAMHSFIISPYLFVTENKIDAEFIMYSLEMDLNETRYRTAAYFFFYDYGLKTFKYNDVEYPISANYLLGREKDLNDEKNFVIVSAEHSKILKEIYEKRIIPMYGVYEGYKLVKPGKIKLIVDYRDSNPTGIRNYLINIAKENGKFEFENYTTSDQNGNKIEKSRLVGYTPNNPNKYTIILTDHIRKIPIERKFTRKENIDKMLEYQVQLRNLCSFTFINIVHLNRNIADVSRMSYSKNMLYPIPEDIKDSGNISEESDVVITMMNPTDERYKLTNHFGVDVTKNPNYRSIHIVESRHTPSPIHLRVNSYAGVGHFEPLIIENQNNYKLNV